MRLLLSFVSMAALVGLIVLVRDRGWFSHGGCTCRDPKHDHSRPH